MKKLVLLLLILVILAFANLVLAESPDYSALNKTYCTILEKQEYCLEFDQSPFGPGWNGDAYVVIKDLDAWFSPVPTDIIWWDGIYSNDGKNIKFKTNDWNGRFEDGKLEISKYLLTLEAE